MTMHYNYPDEIVNGWDSGEPVKALCGFERVLIEGMKPSGELCEECARIAKEQGKSVSHRVAEPDEVRARAGTNQGAGTTYSFTYIGKWAS